MYNKPKQSRLDCLDELRTKPSQTLVVVIFISTKPNSDRCDDLHMHQTKTKL